MCVYRYIYFCFTCMSYIFHFGVLCQNMGLLKIIYYKIYLDFLITKVAHALTKIQTQKYVT